MSFEPSAPSSEWVVLDEWGEPILGDLGCTGFPDGIGPWQWGSCCMVHDLGGTWGELATCIEAQLPDWAGPLVLASIALAMTLHPIYEWMQRKRWVK